jgi:hypothetical protein
MRLRMTFNLILSFALIAVSGAGALAEELNLVGVYADEEMSESTATATAGDILTVYVILNDPINPHLNRPGGEDVDNVGCYSFTLDLTTNLEPVAKAAYPARPECTGVCTEFKSCYGALIPVGGNRLITLISLDVRYLGSGPAEIRLRPPSFEILENQMDFWYRDVEQTGWILPMNPASGSFDIPVFVVNGDQVPATNENWGSLKSTYR